MKFLKRMQRGLAIGIVLVFLFSNVSYAATGDIWNNGVNKGSITNIILHNKTTLFDMIRHIDNYSYEIDGNLYKTNDVNNEFMNNPNSTLEDIHSIVKTTKTPVGNVGITISSVDNINIPDTYIGTVPTLPDVINVSLSNGTTKQVKITWNAAATDVNTYKNPGNVIVNGVIGEYNNYPVSATVVVKQNILYGSFSSMLGSQFVTADVPAGKTIIAVSVNGSTVNSSNYSLDNGTLTILNVTSKDIIIITTNDSVQYSIIASGTAAATIVSIADINKIVNQNSTFVLPTVVSAKLSDNSTKDVPVKWNVSTVDTSKIGTITYYGSVDGYSKQINLSVTVTSLSINAVSPINLSTSNGVVPNLPNSVSITLSDGSSANARISWNQAATLAQTYATSNPSVTINGLLPDYNNYLISATVSVTSSITKPQVPTNVIATAVSSSQINVQWNQVSGVDGYYVYYCNQNSGIYAPLTNSDGSKQLVQWASASLPNLAANTTICIKITSVKNGVESDYSNVVSATTQINKPQAPTNVTATAVSSSQINVQWNQVSGVDGYYVYYCNQNGGIYAPLTNSDGSKQFFQWTSASLSNLTANSTICFKITSVINGVESDYSNVVSATTQVNKPQAPTNVIATAVSSSKISIQWNQVSGVDGYYIYVSNSYDGQYTTYKNSDGSNQLVQWRSDGSLSITGLAANVTKYFRMTSVKNGIESDLSNVASATTLTDKPQAPINVTASTVSSSQIKVQWNVISGVDGYYVYYSNQIYGTYTPCKNSDGTKQLFSNGLATITSIPANTTVYFKITSVKSGVESDYSSIVYATTSSDKPQAPINVTAYAVSTSQINIQWNQVSGVDGYYLYKSSTYDGPYTPSLNSDGTKRLFQWDTDYSISSTGLSAGSTRYYKVTSVKNGVESDFSNIAYATTFDNTPITPTGLTVWESVQGTFYIQWNQVTGVDGYHLYFSYDNSTWYYWDTSSGDIALLNWYAGHSASLYNISSGSTIYFKVSSVKNGVESLRSSVVRSTMY